MVLGRTRSTCTRLSGRWLLSPIWAFRTCQLSTRGDGRPGLFSIPELQEPNDFARLSTNAINECNSIRTDIASSCRINKMTTKLELQLVLRKLDDISKEVCNVIDVTEMCRQTHADVRWREAADSAFGKLSDYMGILNADRSLYDALEIVMSRASQHNISLDEPDIRLVTLLKAEFERDGIHLPDSERDEVRGLQNTLNELEGRFNQNLIRNRDMFEVDNVQPVLQLIPAATLSQMGASIGHNATGNVSLSLLKNENAVLQSLMRYSENSSVRKEMYIAYSTAVPENIPILDELVASRHELASKQGFETFAHRYLADKMAGTPRNVDNFLQQVLNNNRDQFSKDMESLALSKHKLEGSRALEPWDILFYTELNKFRQGDPASFMSKYLSLDSCLHAMEYLVSSLFGINMKEEPMAEQECWDVSTDRSNMRTKLLKYTFSDCEEAPLGTMYLDLHPRENKFGHAAHFTLRCACESHSGESQLPIVALVCNLSSTGGLPHGSVETLFHEFGHALHSLLSRTKYQHMAGTRVAMDFVETPSHLLETFVWDPTFLKILAVDQSTGEPVPDDLISMLLSSRKEFASIERQNQIAYAMFDQQLFGYPVEASPSVLFERLMAQKGIPFASGTHWYSRFGHLVSYGAGYYSYLYSQVFADNLWNHLFEGKSLSRDSGGKLWRGILMHGGQRDPKRLLEGTIAS